MLHTRISEQLAEDIRSLAEDLRVPVSNLVRNVLEEAFTAVEEVSEDVGEILEDVLEEADHAASRFRRYQARRQTRRAAESGSLDLEPEPGEIAPAVEPTDTPDEVPAMAAAHQVPQAAGDEVSRSPFDAVVAWQPVVLNRAQRCARTGAELRPGDEAFLGLTPSGFSGIYLSRAGLDSVG